MPRMIVRKNHPKWFEKWNGKFSTMPKGISSLKILKSPLLHIA